MLSLLNKGLTRPINSDSPTRRLNCAFASLIVAQFKHHSGLPVIGAVGPMKIDMSEKEQIEAHVALAYLEREEERSISSDELSLGNPHKKEPDILYKDMGIEIGAVLRGVNTHIDIYEKKFLKTASEKIAEKIPNTIQIRLVMQDDKNSVQHEPALRFQNYKYLPSFLDGIFILITPQTQQALIYAVEEAVCLLHG